MFTQGILKFGNVAFCCNILKQLQKEENNAVFKFFESNVCKIREMHTKSGGFVDKLITKEFLVEYGIVDILGLYEYEMEFRNITSRINIPRRYFR